MIADGIKNIVKMCINEETKSAEANFPMFASDHEAYAVLKEEIEEATEEMEFCQKWLAEQWKAIKTNENPEDIYESLKVQATLLALEAMQVAAVAQKALDSQEARKEKATE